MLGPRHLPTYLEVVNFETDLEKHHKKLVDIQKNQTRRKNVDKDTSNAKLGGGREKVLKFHNSEKALAIEKDNELLLGRLVEISRKRKNHLFPLTEPNNLPKTLNSNSRKKEKDRIAAENEAFARRLLSQQPSFNRRKLDNDFEKHAERVKLMQKCTYAPRIKLPPIQYLKYEDIEISRKSQSGKEKKSVKDLPKKKTRKNQKMDKLTEDEREDLAEQEELKEKEEAEKILREAKERREKEEAELKEKEEKELLEKKQREEQEKEEAERKAREEQEEKEKAERLRQEEEERAKLADQPDKPVA